MLTGNLQIKVSNLSFFYHPHQILIDNLSLRIFPGEMIHIRGVNGSGKSTFLKLILGLLEPVAGKISLIQNGEDIFLSRKEYFEYLPCDTNGLFLQESAVHNLDFWMKLCGLEASIIEIREMLCQWGIVGRIWQENLPVCRLSTGLRRRLALARMSMSRAVCWFLDEPLHGLDDQAIKFLIWTLTKHLSEGGMILLVNHQHEYLSTLVSKTMNISP